MTMPPWLATALPILAFCIVIGLSLRFAVPRGRTRRLRAKALLRAILPNRVIRSRSGRADIGWFLFSTLFASSAIGWALISSSWVTGITEAALSDIFGAPTTQHLPEWLSVSVTTLALYLAYEFAYWGHHYLSHRVPLLWHFHKVHHSAESLSPLTNFRVHPLETIMLYNVAAGFMGMVAGMAHYGFGISSSGVMLHGQNLVVYLSVILFSHLQHTHFWISFPGAWGRWLLSPAHHQIHHSMDVRHYDSNFGSSLAIFDRMFGTLFLPQKEREKLSFGVEGLGYDPHGLAGSTIMPIVDAAAELMPRVADRKAGSAAA